MEDQIKQIGQRLKGLREVLDIPAEEVAHQSIASQKFQNVMA